jgi:dTDP-4-dehydrorhamnose reductase
MNSPDRVERRSVLVTGAAGQLGSTIVRRFSSHSQVYAFTRTELNIADEAAVLQKALELRPGAIINCAAYNDVDGAEEAAGAALSANALGVLALARAAAASGATFVHYSTDFVFDGDIERPYVESDRTRPISTYGTSKLLGEYFALEAPASYVLRVESLFGGQPAKSSIDKILSGIRSGTVVRAFADRTVSPSYVEDVAAATEKLLETVPAFGVYHCVNDGMTTWLEIAQATARLLDREAEIVPVNMSEMKMKARRPRYCALSNRKLADAGITMPTWHDALARYVAASS